MKKWRSLWLGVMIAVCGFWMVSGVAEAGTCENIGQEEADHYIEDLLKELNFEEIDEFLKEMDAGEKISFGSIVKAMTAGDLTGGVQLFGKMMRKALFGEWKTNRTTIIHVLVISLIAATLTGFSDIFQNKQISEVSYYMVYVLLLTILMKAFGTASMILTETLGQIVTFMKLLMPSFFLALGFSTGSTTGLVFYEWILLLVTIVQWMLQKIILPVIHMYVLLMLVNQMVKEDFLSKMAELFHTASEWMLKTLLAAVMGFNLVQGLIAPAVDGFKKDMITKTAGMIPGVGNVFDSVSDLVLGSAILVKNSIGVAALLILTAVCLIPVLKLLLFSASYKLASAVVQPVSDSRVVECISCIGEGIFLLMKTMLTSGVLFWLTLAVMCAATGR